MENNSFTSRYSECVAPRHGAHSRLSTGLSPRALRHTMDDVEPMATISCLYLWGTAVPKSCKEGGSDRVYIRLGNDDLLRACITTIRYLDSVDQQVLLLRKDNAHCHVRHYALKAGPTTIGYEHNSSCVGELCTVVFPPLCPAKP